VNGHSPVREFLLELKASDPMTLRRWRLGWEKVAQPPSITGGAGDGLFELRHVGKLNTRVLWCFVRGRRIIAVHGIATKARRLRPQDLGTAERRMRDWKERNDS